MLASTIRSALRARVAAPRISNVVRANVCMNRISVPQIRNYSSHHEETFEEFTARYVFNEQAQRHMGEERILWSRERGLATRKPTRKPAGFSFPVDNTDAVVILSTY